MKGWPQNDDPDSFWATPVPEAAKRLAAILLEERPQVVVTYNAHGFYGHPDHIQAHRVTLAAFDLLDYEPTLYFNAVPNSIMAMMNARWEQAERDRAAADAEKGIVRAPEPEDPDDERVDMGTPDELIDAVIDVSRVNEAKYDALAAHHSQIADSFWMKMGRDEFKKQMRTEWFVRVTNPMNLSGSVNDIFAGYR
jgi:LmbE family N-acetylglucosaminyl deacetylase